MFYKKESYSAIDNSNTASFYGWASNFENIEDEYEVALDISKKTAKSSEKLALMYVRVLLNHSKFYWKFLKSKFTNCP